MAVKGANQPCNSYATATPAIVTRGLIFVDDGEPWCYTKENH